MSASAKNQLSRRSLLQLGMIGGVGLSWSDYLRLQAADEATKSAPPKAIAPTAEAVIFLHLQGGPAHLDTLDMKPEAPVAERGEFAIIDSKLPGIHVCEHLPRLAQALDRFTLIRGISHSQGAHPPANEYLLTGNRPSPAMKYPSLGSVAVKERPVDPALPGFVAIPNGEMDPGFLGVAYAPFKTTAVPKAGQPFEVRGLALAEGMTVEKVRDRNKLLADLDQRLRQAHTDSSLVEGLDRFGKSAEEMILSTKSRTAFDTSQEKPQIAKLFAENDLGQSLLLATRLVEHGVRFVNIFDGAWDTHLDNFKNLKTKLLPPFDAGIVALEEALRHKGLLQKTLIIATGEFGRTPTINKNAGRDHWPRTMWTLIAGGGVKAGRLVGGTDSKGHGPDDRTQLKPDDLAATIYHALGIDHRREYITRTGRPALLVPHGEVITELF